MLRKLLGSNLPANASNQGQADVLSFAPVPQDPVGPGVAPDILFDAYTLTSLRHKSFDVATHAQGGLYIAPGGGVITRTGSAVYNSSRYGINIDNGGVLITSAAQSDGVLLPAGTVINSGEIASFGSSGTGVQSPSSATVLNKAEGYIYGASDGVSLYSNSSVTNYGKIYGGIAGIYIRAQLQTDVTYLHNGAMGIVAGGRTGIQTTATATLVNEGEIDGGTYAVYFGSDGDNRLEIDGQAVFNGPVEGGDGNNTLELMEGAAGVLSNFSTEFLHFNTILVDSGSYWTVQAGNGIANGSTLTDAGILVNDDDIDASVVVTRTGVLINNGTINTEESQDPNALLVDGGIFDNTGNVHTTDGIKLATDSTLINAGTIDGDNAAVYLSGAAIRLVVVPGAVFDGGVVGGSGGDTLELAPGTSAGTIPAFANGNQDFSSIQVDDGASWMQAGMNTLGPAAAIYVGGSDTSGLQATLTNAGTIKASQGILLGNDALFTNLAGGQVAAGIYGVSGTSGSIVNAGTIKGSHAGIDLSGQISLTNLAGGYIGGVVGSGTLTNIGTIANVQFSGSASDRVIIVPGAVFRGHVVGGSGTNTLQLAGVGPGTLSNFGQVFQNFGTVVVDVATSWTLDHSDNLGPGTTLSDDGTLTNAGKIGNGVVVGDFGSSLFNQGQISGPVGVSLTLGGYVDNQAGASITGSRVGIAASGLTTVVNAGIIKGSRDAVTFGGTLADRLVVDPGASFAGKVLGNGTTTLELAGIGGATGTATTLTGIGIQFTGFNTITVDSAADWQFAAGQTVAGVPDLTVAGTLANAGVIDSTVTVAGAGKFDNAATVSGMVTGLVVSNAGTVTNGNDATIRGGSFGIDMLVGGSLANEAGASISGAIAGVLAGSGTVTSLGTISGGQVGVSLTAGGSVNVDGGVITGTGISGYGVSLSGGGTILNGGTISGTKAAIDLVGGTDLVIERAGAVLSGGVAGGTGSDTLELAQGLANTTGTLSKFATQFSGFGTIAVDPNAAWALDNTDTIAAGVTLSDRGVLGNAGVIQALAGVVSGGYLTNTGLISGGVELGAPLLLGGGARTGGPRVTPAQSRDAAPPSIATLDNLAGGTISGSTMAVFTNPAIGGIITNAGLIDAVGTAVLFDAGGNVTNQAGGTITATGSLGIGVYVSGGAATVTNAGTISGSLAAINLVGSTADRVVADAGAVW